MAVDPNSPLLTSDVELAGLNREGVENRLARLLLRFQQEQLGVLGGVQTGQEEILSALDQQLADLNSAVSQTIATYGPSAPNFAALTAQNLDLIQNAGIVTPEDQRRIQDVIGSALSLGTEDILAQSRRATETVRDVLAPSRGMRSTDSPIIDVGQRIAEEATRGIAQLERQLRGSQAEMELQYPLSKATAVSNLIGQERGFGLNLETFLANLRQSAMQNRQGVAQLGLTGGLGLLGVSPALGGSAGALFQSFAPQQQVPQPSLFQQAGGLTGIGNLLLGAGSVGSAIFGKPTGGGGWKLF